MFNWLIVLLTGTHIIRIVYRNGYTHDLKVKSFNVRTGSDGEILGWEYKRADGGDKPLAMGKVGDVVAIWQIR
jgi:hypothetical protein